jgi:hypothetical protein
MYLDIKICLDASVLVKSIMGRRDYYTIYSHIQNGSENKPIICVQYIFLGRTTPMPAGMDECEICKW